MDPNATLAEIRALIADSEESTDASDFGRLMELVTALDEWIATGDFLPDAWKQ